jgi:hypothetical protein
MTTPHRALLLACALFVVGCSILDQERGRAALQEQLIDDTEERKARLQAKGTLSPQEYEAMALKMGWTTKGASGLPPAPTTEELEKRVKAAERTP